MEIYLALIALALIAIAVRVWWFPPVFQIPPAPEPRLLIKLIPSEGVEADGQIQRQLAGPARPAAQLMVRSAEGDWVPIPGGGFRSAEHADVQAFLNTEGCAVLWADGFLEGKGRPE